MRSAISNPVAFESGSFAPVWSGFSIDPGASVFYTRVGNIVSLYFSGGSATGTSNATTMSLTSLPASIRPNFTRRLPMLLVNNGVRLRGFCDVAGNGTLSFGVPDTATNPGGFTASGGKGVATQPLTYPIR